VLAEQNPIGHDPVAPAIEALCRPSGRLGHGDTRVQPIQAPSPAHRDRADPIGDGVGGVGVERAHQRQLARGHQRVEADQRHDRLVNVCHVVATGAQGAANRIDRVGRARQIGDRAVGGNPDRAAQSHEILRWLAPLGSRPAVQTRRERVVGIERREDVRLVSLRNELSR
jgi:hypothetical protein